MDQAIVYTAHRSGKRMGTLAGFLVIMGLIMVIVDFSFLVPAGDLSWRNGLRAQGLTRLISALPIFGGIALITVAVITPSLFKKQIEIRISPDGIQYPPALKEVLPWSRIDRIAVRKMAFAQVVSVFIRDADSFPIKPLARKVAAINKAAGDLGDINLETLRSDGDIEQVINAIASYHKVEPLPSS